MNNRTAEIIEAARVALITETLVVGGFVIGFAMWWVS